MIPVRDHNPTAGPVWVVWGLLIACVIGFAGPMLSQGERGVMLAAMNLGLVPAELWGGAGASWLHLLTHAFLHGGWAHLIGNMIFLAVFGDNIEDRMGHGRFLVFYLLAAVVAGLSHAAAVADSPLPLVGASGAISALLGAYLRFYPQRQVQAIVLPLLAPWLVMRMLWRAPSFFLWSLPAWVYLGYWGLLQVFEGFTAGPLEDGGVAWWAHIGGFVFGVLIAPLFAKRQAA